MFHINPSVHSMFDCPVQLSISNLTPNSPVTISCFVDYVSGKFRSCAHFVSDASGSVDLNTALSLGGSYKGHHPMGLFWSLLQTPGQRAGLRLLPRNVDHPIQYVFTAHNGHLNYDLSSEHFECPISSIVLYRHLLHPDVERTEIAHGRIRGGLFVPRTVPKGGLPAIVDLFGTGGGLIQHRAALLASKGFAVLALAYFDYKDTPSIDDVELEYFQEAVDWLVAQPCTNQRGVGVVGVSLGATLATLMGIHCNRVQTAVSINGDYLTEVWMTIRYKGEVLPFATVKDIKALERYAREDDLTKDYRYARFRDLMHIPPEAEFKIETAAANRQFLYLVSEDDQNTQSAKNAEKLRDRMRKCDPENADRRLKIEYFKGAGHLLEPPFVPHAYATWHKMMNFVMVWGGNMVEHAAAQNKMWPLLIQHFTENLGQPVAIRDFSVANAKL